VLRKLVIAAGLLVALAAPGRANACSHDDTAYFESFVDATCVQQPLANTTLDALGGLRLATNGAPTTTSWDTDTDFDNGVNFQSLLFAPLGVDTLARTGTGTSAALGLPSTLLPLTPDGAGPKLGPSVSSVLDGDGVDDPALTKVGSTYYMWYSGTAEDGSGPALFLATSGDGATWSRANGGNPVLVGTPGAFDADGVYGADVIYDPANVLAPYRMWYSGRADVFGGIGYATSSDGVTWIKYRNGGPSPVPVLNHGLAGSADSFSAADPAVIKDGSTWKMWYTGDDSSKKRIAYATSPDGVVWSKGGKVIAPEDPGVSANIAFGAFAPSVFKSGATYTMLLTGRKLVGGGVFQTKIMETTSTDGIVWGGPSPALNPSGTNSNFDYSNLNSPDVLYDPSSGSPYKLYYSGNTIDANGNFHTRVGLATSVNGSSFNKFGGAQAGNSVLDVGALETAFDARQASGLAVAAPGGSGPKFVGFYWGTRGSDFKPRLGEATSIDGSTWSKASGAAEGGAVLALPTNNSPATTFEKGGQRDPTVLYESGTYDLYFTALDAGGTRSIGFASTPEIGGTGQPNNASWSDPAAEVLTGDGSGFDADAAGHPSVIKDGATYVMYYAGTSGGASKIGRATSASPGSGFTAGANPVLDVGSAGQFDAASVKGPVVVKLGAGDYRMLYTGVDAEGLERVGYATSTDGMTWTKHGVALNPSLATFSANELGVEATGMLADGSTLHVWTSGVDRTGRTRGDHATTALPTPVSPQPGVPSGWATYQLGNAATSVRDFRQIARTSSGSSVTLRMSFLQPYSSSGNEFWSEYFPVTATSPAEALNFLLTVHGVRWRAQLSTPASAPSLDKVQLTHAPVSFATSGSASSAPITAPIGRSVSAWSSLVVNTSLFSPSGGGSGSGTVRVLDATTAVQLASAPLSVGGDTTVALSSIPAAAHQALRVVLDLQSDGQATPLVNSLKVAYATQPAVLALTLAASAPSVVYGSPVTLTGALTQGAGLVGRSVSVSAQPVGAAGFSPVLAATTDAAGAYSATVTPTKKTTYKVSYPGVADQLVTVTVAHKLTLTVVRKGTRGTIRGKLLPSHPRRVVIIQVSAGSSWRTLAKLKTSKRSSFKTIRKLKARAKYKFRVKTGADKDHAAGLSRVVYLNRMKVVLGVKLAGRKATFSGRVSPRHPGRYVTVQQLVGAIWVRLGKAKLTRRSTFRLVKTLAPGVYDLRAVTLNDKDHWGGQSATRHVTVA
jgi:predicted GH43/DUF377 family glycosyl hydrolase